MNGPLLLGIDNGTTAVKAALFDLDLRLVARARRPVAVMHPRAGWTEQDPRAIVEAVIEAVAEVLARAPGRAVLGAGLDHQGESVLAWDAASGEPLTAVIVWQDKRQEAMLEAMDPDCAARSGLPLDPYFSSGKLAWLLEHDECVVRARERGTLRMGTVDAFLVDRLAGRFQTDVSTASRTQLTTRGGHDWDEQLLGAFGIERSLLPAVGPSFGALGELRSERWPLAPALTAQLVDQQAALAGSGAVRPGQVKATYGTGVFVLARTGASTAVQGLLPTVAWAAPDASGGVGTLAHALDGGVFAAGSLLDWLAGGLGLAPDAAALAALAANSTSDGVMVLPAIAGLGAPWWEPGAHGVIAGLHGGVGPAQIARAALEAITWRVADIVEAMAAVTPIESLRVDGGMTANPTLPALQADALGIPVLAGPPDSTVLGAAMLAGVGAGAFESVEQAAGLLDAGRAFEPAISQDRRGEERARWRAFVHGASGLTS